MSNRILLPIKFPAVSEVGKPVSRTALLLINDQEISTIEIALTEVVREVIAPVGGTVVIQTWTTDATGNKSEVAVITLENVKDNYPPPAPPEPVLAVDSVDETDNDAEVGFK